MIAEEEAIATEKPPQNGQLPAGWSEAVHEGNTYYYNEETGETSMEMPSVEKLDEDQIENASEKKNQLPLDEADEPTTADEVKIEKVPPSGWKDVKDEATQNTLKDWVNTALHQHREFGRRQSFAQWKVLRILIENFTYMIRSIKHWNCPQLHLINSLTCIDAVMATDYLPLSLSIIRIGIPSHLSFSAKDELDLSHPKMIKSAEQMCFVFLTAFFLFFTFAQDKEAKFHRALN